MDKNQLKYKLFKSFRIPLTSEDRVTGKMHINLGELVNITIVVDELNYDFMTFSTSEKIPYEMVELELSRSARLFGKEKIQIQGHIILSKRSKDHSKHKYQYTIAIVDNENYKHWVQDFISQFSKKRLHSYLLASATRMKNLDFEDMSETICLLIDSFNTISDGHNDLKITNYLHTCRDLIGCKTARIWLYDVSENTLSCQYSTNPEESELKQDFRKGVSGRVFNNGEIVNIYNSPLLENKTTSILAGPISNRFHKVIGVLEFEEKEDDTRFDLDDESMIRMLTVCFSSHFQMFNPVNSSSKVKLFNPGLKSNFLNLIELNNDQSTLHLIQKLRSNNENIIINHSSAEALEIIVEELVQGSNYHDRKVIRFNEHSNTVDLKKLNNSIVILDRVDEYSKDMQDEIVELIGSDTIWVISTCHKSNISKSAFTEKFWTNFAKHHVNMQRSQSNEAPQAAFIKLANSVQHLSSFDEKVSYLTMSLGLNSQKNKQAA